MWNGAYVSAQMRYQMAHTRGRGPERWQDQRLNLVIMMVEKNFAMVKFRSCEDYHYNQHRILRRG